MGVREGDLRYPTRTREVLWCKNTKITIISPRHGYPIENKGAFRPSWPISGFCNFLRACKNLMAPAIHKPCTPSPAWSLWPAWRG